MMDGLMYGYLVGYLVLIGMYVRVRVVRQMKPRWDAIVLGLLAGWSLASLINWLWQA